MIIEIHDPALEARIARQMSSTGTSSARDALLRLLDTQEEQDQWLLENKSAIAERIQHGLDQLGRGEGIPEDQVEEWLTRMKAQPE